MILLGSMWRGWLNNEFQTSGNWNQEPRTKSKDSLVLIEIFCLFHTSDLRLPTSDFIPQTSDNRQQITEPRTKSKDQRLFSAN